MMIQRLFCFGHVLALLLCLPLAGAELTKVHPNILFLFSDDQRCDTIAALGNKHIRTPNLDRLVREGTAFTRNYYMGGWHGAVCAPSRAMLMSGRTINRVKENLAGVTTWPEQFSQAGYQTFITGKWHNSRPALLRVFVEGRAVFLGGMGDPYKLPIMDFSAGKVSNQRLSRNHSVQLFADSAIDFIKRSRADRPFLCYVAFNAPHDPRVAPATFHSEHNSNPPPLPPKFSPAAPIQQRRFDSPRRTPRPLAAHPENTRQQLADYYSYITFMDAQIGRILEALKVSGQYDRTLIIFASDNGLAIGSHGLFGKQNLYDHSTHLPLIIAGPGVPKDQRSAAFSYLIDIFPTLGEFCGVSAPTGSEGKSLVPILRGQATSVRDSVFTSYRQLQRAVRDDRWHLIAYPRINKTQLFDLQNDPDESKDLSADPAHAPDLNRMLALLKKWQQEMDDPLSLTTNKPDAVEFDFSKVPPNPQPAKK